MSFREFGEDGIEMWKRRLERVRGHITKNIALLAAVRVMIKLMV